MTLSAIAPDRNAVVHAAAGTGKTWLLVSRIVRLLLAGAKPSSILAITFTRKAAAEMRLRVGDRLLALAQASDAERREMLAAIGAPTDAATAERAARLYEELLVAVHELRATTFHAFCQELLARFAFEAGVPPTFEVVEQPAELEMLAWRALDSDLADRTGPIAEAMERLLRDLGGLDNTRKALQEFLEHRSDWWAYTEGETDAVEYACARLRETLEVDPAHDPLGELARDPEVRDGAREIAEAIGRDTPASLQPMYDGLRLALAAEGAAVHRRLMEALYTKDGRKPRVFKLTKAIASALGPARCERLAARHESLLERVQRANEQRRRHATWARTCDWYRVGARLLHHFQQAKRAEGVLDFADLEWCAYTLLTSGRHAEWVQYKLDQRIDHVLVDEFQDTNPTQWRLLLPLLQEMAAGSHERTRSVFLVGDEKQSIYRFRRAEPELFGAARDWLAGHTGAGVYEQHVSWRSSPAVVRFVNLVFEPAPDDPAAHTLQNFRQHETHRGELWGHAELLPLVRRPSAPPAPAEFRDPLAQPRVTEEDQRRQQEGDMVARKILELIGRPIRDKHGIRPLRFGDVLLLVRTRTHTAAYEAALRRAGIPYAGAGRGNFLECLEVRDMVNLLRVLISPWENLALASVLRSPVFAATDDDLLTLAALDPAASWYERLLANYGGRGDDTPLARAARLLRGWRALADRIPVHDLLDRIYFEADVPPRYRAAAPAHLASRVAANLTRLLDLALEADAGRFPSLARFLARLDVMTEEDTEATGSTAEAGDQVRLLTIHAAKGLESPVVFLLDAARDPNGRERGAEALVEWPSTAPRPTDFLLLAGRREADARSRALLERGDAARFQEESNLLYVALTRAQQYLYVSGCESGPRRNGAPSPAGDPARGWYGHIERRLRAARDAGAGGGDLVLHEIREDGYDEPVNLCGAITHGLAPALPPQPAAAPSVVAVDPALTRPFDAGAPIVPAPEDDETSTLPGADPAAISAAQQRGVLIHRMLERLTADGASRERARAQVRAEFGASVEPASFEACWREACAVVDAPALRRLFDPALYADARNEVAVLYRTQERDVTGIVDRVVFAGDRLLLVDYKTHHADPAQLPALVERYTPQLRLYAEGLRRLWPGREIEALLVFTAGATAVDVPLD